MLTRDIYQLTKEFPLTDRIDLDLAIEKYIAIIDLVRHRSEGELPYCPYSDALH